MMEISTMLLVLIFGAGLTLAIPKQHKTAAKILAIVTSIIPLFLSMKMLLDFVPGQAGYQFTENGINGVTWVAPIGIRYIVGVDGISIPLVFLSTLLTTMALIYSWDEERRTKEYFSLMLVMELGVLGVFTCLDYFVFYIFWEMVLIPMYFFIGIWGGPRKHYASIKFFIYTHVASVVMFIGIAGMFFRAHELTGVYSFSMIDIANTAPGFDIAFQGIVFVLLFFGFATKMPTVPLHTWLPDAHVEAPTAGSVLLAGVLLKMGGYGLIRISVTTLPKVMSTTYVVLGHALPITSAVMAILGTISILYAAVVCLAQKDLKKLVAYSSVSHMGIVLLGVSTMTEAGISAAVYMMFAHGLVTAVLFMMCGSILHKSGTRLIDRLGGITTKAPFMGAFLLVGCLASLGLPGLVSFVAEFMVFYSVYDAFGNYIWIPVMGVLVTSAYYLWACQRAIFGPYNKSLGKIKDLEWFELVPLTTLIAMIAIFGIYPTRLLDMINPASGHLADLLGGVP